MPMPDTRSLPLDKLVFLDTETTGGSTRRDRVIEVGAIRVENQKIVKKFQTLLDPGIYLPQEITNLTGILPTQLESAPTFRQIADQLAEIMDGAIMVAHNVRFDYAFLKNEFKLIGQDFSPKQICTVRLSRSLFPGYPHHNLDSIIERFGFKCKKRHRAFDDAYILWEFYQKILTMFDEQVLLEAISKTLKRPTIPIKISLTDIKALPEKVGVYIFYGEGGMPLYVGKSVNIKKRVLSHFSADHLSQTEMAIAQQVESIETIVTSGELGALFKESKLVKALQPLYNRKLRRKQKLNVLKQKTVDEYSATEIMVADLIEREDLDNFLGVFRSKMSIKQFLTFVAKEYNLCEKLLGLEKTSTGCFAYRLGRCKGACLGKESPQDYNLRFNEAFSSLRVKPWPFNQAIQIIEKDEEGNGEAHIFDKWCYLGSIQYSEFDTSSKLERDIEFDLDTYKILDSFLRSGKRLSSIRPFNLQQLTLADSL